MLTRLPVTLVAAICSTLTLGELARFRCASRHARTIGESRAASPTAIGFYTAEAARRRRIANLVPAGWTIVAADDNDEPRSPPPPVDPTDVIATAAAMSLDWQEHGAALFEAAVADANQGHLFPPLPDGLLCTICPREIVFEVDQGRVDQLGCDGGRAAVASASAAAADADAGVVDVAATGAVVTVRPTVAARKWTRNVTRACLLIRPVRDVGRTGAWSVRDLRALQSMTQLRQLRILAIDMLHPNAGATCVPRLCAHLPVLPHLATLKIEHLYSGAALRDIARAFPALQRLDGVELWVNAFAPRDAIAIDDWRGFTALRAASCIVDIRDAEWALPTALEVLHLLVPGDRDVKRFVLPPLVDIGRTHTRLRSLSIDMCGSSVVPFVLLYDAPTLRSLELCNVLHAWATPEPASEHEGPSRVAARDPGQDGSDDEGDANEDEGDEGKDEKGDVVDGDGGADGQDETCSSAFAFAAATAAAATTEVAVVAATAVVYRESLLENLSLRGDSALSTFQLPPTQFTRLRSLVVVARRCNIDAFRWPTTATATTTPPPPHVRISLSPAPTPNSDIGSSPGTAVGI